MFLFICLFFFLFSFIKSERDGIYELGKMYFLLNPRTILCKFQINVHRARRRRRRESDDDENESGGDEEGKGENDEDATEQKEENNKMDMVG